MEERKPGTCRQAVTKNIACSPGNGGKLLVNGLSVTEYLSTPISGIAKILYLI